MKLLNPNWPTCMRYKKDIESFACVCPTKQGCKDADIYPIPSTQEGRMSSVFCWDTIGYSIPTCSFGVAHLYPSAIHFLSLLLHREKSGSRPRVLRRSPPMCPRIYTSLPNVTVSTIQPIHQVLPQGLSTEADFLKKYNEFLTNCCRSVVLFLHCDPISALGVPDHGNR